MAQDFSGFDSRTVSSKRYEMRNESTKYSEHPTINIHAQIHNAKRLSSKALIGIETYSQKLS